MMDDASTLLQLQPPLLLLLLIFFPDIKAYMCGRGCGNFALFL